MSSAGQIIQNIVIGVVPTLLALIVFLVRRRPEIRNLDADADTKAVTSAGVAMDSLERAIKRSDEQVTVLGKQLQEERATYMRQLNTAHSEISRLGGLVASLRIEQSICQQQIEQLQKRLGDDATGRRGPP